MITNVCCLLFTGQCRWQEEDDDVDYFMTIDDRLFTDFHLKKRTRGHNIHMCALFRCITYDGFMRLIETQTIITYCAVVQYFQLFSIQKRNSK